jgi:hypothetical protein
MKLTLGANEPKKVAILGGLIVVAAVVFWMNQGGAEVPSRPVNTGPRPTVPLVAPQRPSTAAPDESTRPRASARERQVREFRPSLKPKRPEDRPDPLTVDPALRLDLLAKLQTVNVEGVHRSIFDFGAPPAPKPDPTAAKKPVPSPIIDTAKAKEEPAKPPPPPPPPKIPLKFYGFTTAKVQTGPKRAFFVEGDCSSMASADCNIHVVTEGEVVKKRYKIVRIGVNSVVVEDLDHKNEQTLPLEEAPVG